MPKKATSPMSRAIREARAKLGLTQHELARLAKVARITIANVELGKHSSIRPTTAYKLAKALNIDATEILPGTGAELAASKSTGVADLLDSYTAVKAGTAVEPTARERVWLEKILACWGQELPPTHASILFLLLARRHGDK